MTAIAAPKWADADLPICVDLDGSLLKIDTLHEAALSAVLKDPRVLFHLPLWLARGKAFLKEQLAARWTFDPAYLPYNASLLAFIEEARQQGRRLVLVTAADRAIAESVAEHLGLFDDVIASDGTNNLRGDNKAKVLCERFGERGFIYAGNDSTDHHIWQKSLAAILVNAPASVKRIATGGYAQVTEIDDPRPSPVRSLIKAMRPYQWVKNSLVFAPLILSGSFGDLAGWKSSSLAFAAFCLVASGIYLLNDMSDIASDRMHHRNKLRPFASGALPIGTGLIAAPLLILAGFVLGWGTGAAVAIGAYFAMSMSYNLKLKEMPLVDVFLLAALYTIRMYGGGEASGYSVSLWLLGFSSFLFLSLAIIKRASELHRLKTENRKANARRGYMVDDLEFAQMMGIASTFASDVVLCLYIQSDAALLSYANPTLLWAIIPLILFWQCRLWLSTTRGYMHDDPIVYAARDWVSWTVFTSISAVALTARFSPAL